MVDDAASVVLDDVSDNSESMFDAEEGKVGIPIKNSEFSHDLIGSGKTTGLRHTTGIVQVYHQGRWPPISNATAFNMVSYKL